MTNPTTASPAPSDAAAPAPLPPAAEPGAAVAQLREQLRTAEQAGIPHRVEVLGAVHDRLRQLLHDAPD